MVWNSRNSLGLITFLWIANAGLASECLSQESFLSIEILRVRVIDAPFRSYEIGDRLIVNVDSEDIKKAGGAGRIRIRIFRGSANDLIHRRSFRTNDGRFLFFSELYEPSDHNGGLNLNDSIDATWLRSETDRLEDGIFLLIFEKFEKATKPSKYVKLREVDLEKYFREGFHITISAPRSMTRETISKTKESHSKGMAEVRLGMVRINMDPRVKGVCNLLTQVTPDDTSDDLRTAVIQPYLC